MKIFHIIQIFTHTNSKKQYITMTYKELREANTSITTHTLKHDTSKQRQDNKISEAFEKDPQIMMANDTAMQCVINSTILSTKELYAYFVL